MQVTQRGDQPDNSAVISGFYLCRGLTFFEASVKKDNFSWTIFRRYSWFRTLYSKLAASHKKVAAMSFPEKRWFMNTSTSVINERKKGLQQFLNFIFQDEGLIRDKHVTCFLFPIRQLTLMVISKKQPRMCFMDPIVTVYPEYNGRGFFHHEFGFSKDIFTGVSWMKDLDEERMTLQTYLQELTNQTKLNTWESFALTTMEERLVVVKRQLVRLAYAHSSSASTDISGEESMGEAEMTWKERRKNSTILQDAEIDFIVASQNSYDDSIIAGPEDGIDSDDLSL
eukprot:TRINITY_DN2983_c0_g1_i2.p1 TRINITY_DN2983_c0_g1~~TRINITY_DN2983_c0_g1_i2.p1  ORF type:complete len:302 (-),score=32.55 TRINITY_DN2983_c0_g1_i2:129-977(-)